MFQRKGNVLVLVSVGLALIITLGMGYLYLQNQQLKQSLLQQKLSQPTPIASSALTQYVSPSPATQANEMANWKTYINRSLGISFKYPNTYLTPIAGLNSYSGERYISFTNTKHFNPDKDNVEVVIVVTDTKNNDSLDQFFKDIKAKEIYQQSGTITISELPFTLDGLPAMRYQYQWNNGANKGETIFTIVNNKRVRVSKWFSR